MVTCQKCRDERSWGPSCACQPLAYAFGCCPSGQSCSCHPPPPNPAHTHHSHLMCSHTALACHPQLLYLGVFLTSAACTCVGARAHAHAHTPNQAVAQRLSSRRSRPVLPARRCSLGVMGVDVHVRVFTQKHSLMHASDIRKFLIAFLKLMVNTCQSVITIFPSL